MKKVLAFGAFDPINKGHKDFLRQARLMGDHLTVVVAHDSAIRAHKGRDPEKPEQERRKAVEDLGIANEVLIGRKSANKYHILQELEFDVVALGYGQKPTDEKVRQELDNIGKHHVQIIRCEQYDPGSGVPWQRMLKIILSILLVLAIAAVLFVGLQAGGS